MQQTVTYVPNVANAEITLAASKDPVIADNNDLTTLTATVADTEGNAIANTEGNIYSAGRCEGELHAERWR